MAVLTRSHPTDPDTERHYNGKKITAVTVDFAVNGTNFASTELGAEGALNAAIKVLTQQANPIIQSDIEADGGEEMQVKFSNFTTKVSSEQTLMMELTQKLSPLTYKLN